MNILLITSRYPWPPTRGNQVRTVEWLKALGGDDVHVVAPYPGALGTAGGTRKRRATVTLYRPAVPRHPWSVAGSVLRGLSAQESMFATPSGGDAVRRVVRATAPSLAIVQMMRVGWALDVLDEEGTDVPVLFDAIDSMGLHYRRMGDTSSGVRRVAARLEADRCERREHACAERAALTVAVSPRDLEAIHPPAGRGRVVPVSSGRSPRPSGPADDPVVVLSGNLGYRPTREGARWFARAVWPAVRRRVPEARWVLAGARPPGEVRRLGRLEGIEVVADPPSLDPFFEGAAVAIAPMRSGSGVPMKVLEAWARALPVVAHPWAASGLLAEPGRDMLVAETADQWSQALVRVLTDGDLAARLGRAGAARVEGSYSPERIRGALSAAAAAARAARSASRTVR